MQDQQELFNKLQQFSLDELIFLWGRKINNWKSHGNSAFRGSNGDIELDLKTLFSASIMLGQLRVMYKGIFVIEWLTKSSEFLDFYKEVKEQYKNELEKQRQEGIAYAKHLLEA